MTVAYSGLNAALPCRAKLVRPVPIVATGEVFAIRHGSTGDGPGARTLVCLKGCPLRCVWCCNAEAWDPLAPADEYSVDRVMEEVCRDRALYEGSGGGVTISGGEPTKQFRFCRELLREAKAEGIHTCLDTCGWNRLERFMDVKGWVDLFLWDYKATGAALHTRLTGVPSKLILLNFEMLYAAGARIVLRCPLVPGVNDGPEHLAAIARLAEQHPRLAGIELLPYRSVTPARIRAFPPSEDLKAEWRRAFEARACPVSIVS